MLVCNLSLNKLPDLAIEFETVLGLADEQSILRAFLLKEA
jgi:hypothetical protein